jgi:hypothetical protein
VPASPRGARLTHAAWRLGAPHQLHVNLWRLVDTQYAVVAEVGLLDAALFDRDLAVEPGRQAKYDAAFDLSANRIGIDRDAAIDRAPDVRRVNGAIRWRSSATLHPASSEPRKLEGPAWPNPRSRHAQGLRPRESSPSCLMIGARGFQGCACTIQDTGKFRQGCERLSMC